MFTTMRLPLATVALVTSVAAPAWAATQDVEFNVLLGSATFTTPFVSGDTLIVDTLVTGQSGPLLQTVNFTVGGAPGVTAFEGAATWQISTGAGPGPRVTGFNVDIFNAANALVASDTFLGTLGGYAVSNFASATILPGAYRMVITGTAIRDVVADLSLSFTTVVPEPRTYGMMLAGLGVLALLARRRKGQ